MVLLPLYVKRRDALGATGPAMLCDDVQDALEIANEFRQKGFTDVWIEDTDGRPVNEDVLRNASRLGARGM
jgi:hypothetical protein